MSDKLHAERMIAITKRTFDICFSCIGVLICLPLFPVIALAIKLSSPGPILFRQLRVGMQHADRVDLFEILKFRSMVFNAEATSGPVLASENDCRVTWVGKFLRKTHLDELPQFINVLKGDMSLIGPRPERPAFYLSLDKNIPFFVERINGVRPGITGLAQVNQRYDRCLDDVCQKFGFDMQYCLALTSYKEWLLTDFIIIAKTLLVMLMARGQ